MAFQRGLDFFEKPLPHAQDTCKGDPTVRKPPRWNFVEQHSPLAGTLDRPVLATKQMGPWAGMRPIYYSEHRYQGLESRKRPQVRCQGSIEEGLIGRKAVGVVDVRPKNPVSFVCTVNLLQWPQGD